jgi:hypothetical protein
MILLILYEYAFHLPGVGNGDKLKMLVSGNSSNAESTPSESP